MRKGEIRVGFDADLAVVDLKSEFVFDRSMVQSKCGWSPFEGSRFIGRNVHTLVGGSFALRDGAIYGTPSGRIPVFE
jgi:dihydroorotase